jgi:multidrug efflux pump subunit AcrA (membrane-fusion protein)
MKLFGSGLLALGLMALVIGVVRPWVSGPGQTQYTTGTVTIGNVTATSVATGTVQASMVYGLRFGSSPDIVDSTSTTSGTGGTMASGAAGSQSQNLTWPVSTVAAKQGQQVKKGDVLATADPAAAKVALLSAQANLASAQSRLSSDQANSKSSTSTILEDQAQVATAQAACDSAQAAASDYTLVAPADGQVISVDILAGIEAPSGYAIELAAGPMVAVASFTESDVKDLQPGQTATVNVTALDSSVAGVVASVAPAPASATSSGSGGAGSQSSVVSYAVRVTLTSPPTAVRSGMTATVTVTTGSAMSVVRAPATSVSGSSSTGYTVRIVNSDGTVTVKSVQIGLVTSSYVEITSGLSGDETVVTGTSATRNGTTTTTGGGIGFPGGAGLLGR